MVSFMNMLNKKKNLLFENNWHDYCNNWNDARQKLPNRKIVNGGKKQYFWIKVSAFSRKCWYWFL